MQIDSALDRLNDSGETATGRRLRWVITKIVSSSIETAEVALNRAEMARFLAPKWPISDRRNTPVGTDRDTAAFAVNTIATWCRQIGHGLHPGATRLLITADGGGSNGSRTRLWKMELAALAAQTGLEITVCHLPPGASKWNKIEHRLFSHISMNWRGRPLTSHEVIVETIAATTTTTGLSVQAEPDTNEYPVGIKIPDKQMRDLDSNGILRRHDFDGEWNCTLKSALGDTPETT